MDLGGIVMTKNVAIIGAGLAGLSAGICLQRKGIATEIYELAPWAGGQCTAWDRGGYRFDGCVHWMVGTRKGDPIYDMYRDVGALDESTEIYNAPSVRLEMGGGTVEVPFTFDAFRAFLLARAAGDEAEIEKILRDIEVMTRCELPLGAPETLPELIRFVTKGRGFLSLARKHGKKTVKEYLSGLKSDEVRRILYQLMPPDFSATGLIMMLGTRMSGNAGYPMGGAGEIIRRMVEKYESLGGKLHLNTRVDEIAVENGAATGVRIKGAFQPADYVVAACDAHDALSKMLGGNYAHPQLDTLLADGRLFDPLALVSFGLDRRFDIPYAVSCECPEGIETSPDTKAFGFGLRSFDFDPAAAPEGGSSVMAMLEAPFEYWANLRNRDLAAYRAEKQRLAGAVALELEKRMPGFAAAIRVTDVATPATYLRLTNVFKASYEGFAPVPELITLNIKRKVPGLDRFMLTGQWTTVGGGICTAVADGMAAAKKVAKELK
jgi:phytoene dehydrogenase-like protein